MDWNEPQFCDDHGYCICGNDCGAGCCTTENPCEGHRAAREQEKQWWEKPLPPAPIIPVATFDPGRKTVCGRCETPVDDWLAHVSIPPGEPGACSPTLQWLEVAAKDPRYRAIARRYTHKPR